MAGAGAPDSDALVLLKAVLLDELLSEEERQEGASGAEAAAGTGAAPRSGPVVVAQIKTSDVLPLLMFSCSERVVPVPTSTANALRCAAGGGAKASCGRLARSASPCDEQRPATSPNSTTPCLQVCAPPAAPDRGHAEPHADRPLLQGARRHRELPEGVAFGDLLRYFLGLINQQMSYCQLNPPPGRLMAPGDELVMLRPGSLGLRYAPLEEAVQADPGPGWDPAYLLKTRDEQPLGALGTCCGGVGAVL